MGTKKFAVTAKWADKSELTVYVRAASAADAKNKARKEFKGGAKAISLKAKEVKSLY